MKKWRIVIGVQIFLICLVLGGLAVYYFGGYGAKISAMKSSAKELVQNSTRKTFRSVETSLVYDIDENLISRLKGEKDVYYLEYEEIPVYVKAAITSIEDKKFYTHKGYDGKAIIRAVLSIIKNKSITQGASTITQQLARNIFLTHEVSWERKMKEIFLAVELEKKYNKNEILEFYLNNIYFGNGYYGIQAASKGYFNKEVNKLSLSEIAFLCGIPNNPTMYNPFEHMNATLERRNRILDQMLEDGKISNYTYKEAIAEGIVLEAVKQEKSDYVETYTYYCAARVLMQQQGFQLQTSFRSEEEKEGYEEEYSSLYSECQMNLYQKGYRIYTSMDMEIQQKLQDTVDNVLSEYTEVNEEGVYTLQGSAVCINNKTGMVTAIVGGRNQNMAGYTLNRAYQSFRQPGSAIKPILVYTPILERGYKPDTIVKDIPIEDGPKNADGSYMGNITLRKAVEKSRNTVAWSLLEEITPRTGFSYLEKMNFSKLSDLDLRPAAALGGFTNGTSAVEMASAYAAVENDGKYRNPGCIEKITDADGNIIYENKHEEVQVYEENASRMMTDILEGVLTEGTGKGLALSSMPSAGKTGTTNDNKDGWFVGYTPYYTTSVWVGYDMPKTLPGLSGGSYPGKIWNTFMEDIHEGLEPMEFLNYVHSGMEETPSEGILSQKKEW